MLKALKNPLIVFAMHEESQSHFDDLAPLYTGIGKVNAAYGLTKSIPLKKPDIVINLGTAGSTKHKSGQLINPHIFIQRDMDVTPLGFSKYQTPFSQDPPILEYGEKITTLINGTCGSGDNFETGEEAKNFDVVDMEAFALALICKRENIPFLCLKFISDGADGSAAKDWNTSLKLAAKMLRDQINKIRS